MNKWIEENLKELKLICNKITRSDDVDDLLQLCIEQLLKNQRAYSLPDQERLYFFARIVRNNYSSKSSPYYHQYKKYQFIEFKDIDIPDVEYRESPINIEWVNNKITQDKKTDKWYFARLFQIYLEEDCSIKNTAKRTTIPPNTVSKDINSYRRDLRTARQNFLDNGM